MTQSFLRFDIEAKNEESFFTNSERSLIVKEILDRTAFSVQDPSKYGIHKLLDKAIFSAAYPLHEGPYKSDQDEDAFNGIDKDRQVLKVRSLESELVICEMMLKGQNFTFIIYIYIFFCSEII